tara:strand:- start:91 stop:417 length:327 start_codon:yes stop_codon:yes gene_type:complete
MDHHMPQQTDLTDIPNRFADVLLNQASLLEMVLCAMLVALGYYIHHEGKSAKGERQLNQEKFESLIIRTQDTTVKMASDLSNITARIDNIERELESQKDFLFANLRTK